MASHCYLAHADGEPRAIHCAQETEAAGPLRQEPWYDRAMWNLTLRPAALTAIYVASAGSRRCTRLPWQIRPVRLKKTCLPTVRTKTKQELRR